MANKNSIYQSDGFSETCSSIISGVISVFLLFLVTVFPLIYHHSYFDILETKYKCYYMSVIGMLAIVLVLALIMLVIDLIEFKGAHAAELFSALAPRRWRETFHLSDAAALVFWIVSVISTLQSDYLYESFWGNEGRYSGLFLITLYTAFYFVVSRFWKMKGWVLELFLISGMVMCIIGITDYFQMDILDFRGAMKPEQSTLFTSTVGNINTYTAYVAMVMGVAASMFAMSGNVLRSIWYYGCLVISFFAIIMGCSDNAYLALGAMFMFLPFVLFRSRRGMLRYLVILATFATVIQCIDYINLAFADVVIGLDSLFRVLANFGRLLVVVLLLWAVTAAFYFVCQAKYPESSAAAAKGTGDVFGKWAVRVWMLIVAAGFAFVLFALYDANVAGNGERYGSLGTYLVFNDHWGTNRGYIWKKSVELYQNFPVMRKLFGYGPDTFGIMTTNEFRYEMVQVTSQVFDTAHNEYIQFLLTVGLLGAAAYVVFLTASCWRMVKEREKNLYILACAIGVLCYAFQALVNLNLPIATPMMWLLLSVGVAAGRH